MCEQFYPLRSEFTWLLLPGSVVMRDSDVTLTIDYVLYGTASVATRGTVAGTHVCGRIGGADV